ncbi:MAG TPA: RHS repeat-associated core domain-containing protein [Solirubrobacteraceae bacterium]|nr:RHS repeat-associated core domain-containing protein [Solirubrobacteraceae bacterium]
MRIPQDASRGLDFPRSDISIRPVDASGRPPRSLGTALGAGIDYPNTALDTDTLITPLPQGAEIVSLLRSAMSPDTLAFALDLPNGEQLVSGKGSRAAFAVMRGHSVIATIMPPTATDAEGTNVPVTTKLIGATLHLKVLHRGHDYRYPIAVDPTVEENLYGEGKIDLGGSCPGHPSETLGATWAYYKGPGTWQGNTTGCSAQTTGTAPMNEGGFGFFYFRTQGESRIYKATATTYATTTWPIEHETAYQTILGIENPHTAKTEGTHAWIGKYEEGATVCALSECAPGKVEASNDENEVFFEALARETFPTGFSASAGINKAVEYVLQEAPPTVSIPATEQQAWRTRAAVKINSRDPGVGLVEGKATSPSAPGWSAAGHGIATTPTLQHNECYESACGGKAWEIWPEQIEALPNGEDTIQTSATDAAGLTTVSTGTLKIDHGRPFNDTIAGVPHNEIGYGIYKLKASAQEGTAGIPSSGIASLKLEVDGKEVGTPQGSCSVPIGVCTASGEWTIVGSEYAAGKHTVSLVATSGAGVTSFTNTPLAIHAAEALPLGPGTVNSASGAFVLKSTDVDVPTPGAPLAIERSYDSRQFASEGHEGPFGQPWQGIGVTGAQSLIKLADGDVILVAASGQQSIFTKEGASFTPPPGDGNLTLKELSASNFTLADQQGDITTFTVPQGGSGTELTPSRREVSAHSATTTFTYETVGGVTRPVQELAPAPAGVSCTTLVNGCRALQFVYASSTTASGEAPSEWGNYAGRIIRITFTAYNRTTAKMQTTAVAEYAYDKRGRLRAAWDPRISPALKATYGYDSENEVTAVTPPGQQPWLINYGTALSDATSGRVVSVARPPASTPFGNGLAPSNTEAPTLSTSAPVMEREVSVSKGHWSNSPLTYSYQWERCNASGGECAPIAGAVDPGYSPRPSDGEHSIKALVTATNAGGSASSLTSASAPIAVKPHYVLSAGSWGTGSSEFKSPAYAAVASPRNELRLFVTDTANSRVQELDLETFQFTGNFGKAGTGPGQFGEPTGIATPSQTDSQAFLAVADSTNKRIGNYWANEGPEKELNSTATEGTGALRGVAQLPNEMAFVAQGAEQNRLMCDCTRGGQTILTYGSTGSGNGQFKEPAGLAISPTNKDIYVVDAGNGRVEFFTTKENAAHEEELAYAGQFGELGSGPGQFKEPKGITVDSAGNVWVVDSGNYRVEGFGPEGKYLTEFGEKTSATQWEEKGKEAKTAKEKRERAAEAEAGPGQLYKPVGIASYGTSLYVVDSGDSRIERWTTAIESNEPPPSGKAPESGGNAVWTVDYQVPVSGTKAPYALNTTAIAAWAQIDAPKEGTAVFPPDEPMGWPASDYRRATVYYRDSKDREVNTALPTGGIATREYNSMNDVVRTLSPDNRAAALKEGANSAATSRLLDTQTFFNAEGTRVTGTLGPQHTVVLPNGKKVSARRQVQSSYDEGAPSEGGPYRVVTKTIEAALVGEKQEDVRTTQDQYGGQSNLGWSLREPTSITHVNPEGENSTSTTLFDHETGDVTEERKPANPSAPSPHATETIYYAAGSSGVPACASHPEWAAMPCETRPAVQPETVGVPNLPVTLVKYNFWLEPEEIVETIGANTRATSIGHDAAGRETSYSVTATTGAPLPTVNDEYSTETGVLTVQSTTVEGTTKSLHFGYNSLLQLVSYTDADGNTATNAFDIDGRLETTSDVHGSQTFAFSASSGLSDELKDSAAGTFGVVTDLEGNPTIIGYPNGMSAFLGYNQVSEPTSLEYIKTRHCESSCTWYTEERVPSIHGQVVIENSTLASKTNKFDPLGRLSQVSDTPAGKGCVTRVYSNDPDTNRTSLKTYEPSSTGKCSTTKLSTSETHKFDEADRLTDPGTSYTGLGDVSGLSEADGGGASLTSAFYVGNELQSITQHESATQKEEKLSYVLDPAGRPRETLATGQILTANTISHYDGPAQAPAWTVNAMGEWARNIFGIGGSLVATQSNGAAPVLQIPNLDGDIVATAAVSETATGFLSTLEPGEYGVPTGGSSQKYAWLGTMGIASELPTGVMAMGARTYVASVGRFLQPDPVPGGSANEYGYTFGDPIDASDPSGEYTVGGPSQALIETATQLANEAAAEQAAINAAAAREAEEERQRISEEEAARIAATNAEIEAQMAALSPAWFEGSGGNPFASRELGGFGRGRGHRHCGSSKSCTKQTHGGTSKEEYVKACGLIGGGIGGAIGTGEFATAAGGAIGDIIGERLCGG